ncbi:MAG: efflux transporter outer membrane subunit [Sulfurovaceae bacterium]|nr:efflux transporter outer membrane subunit [Sulfurovaceae bacterium]
MKKYVYIIFVSLFFAGCVPKLAPSPQMLKIGKNDSNPVTSNIYWWKNSKDDRLNTLIDKAISSSPTIDIAKTRIDMAKAQYHASSAQSMPSVAFNGSGTENRPSSNDLLSPPFVPSKYDMANLGLNANYEFDFWGKTSSDIRSKLGLLQAQRAELNASTIMLSTAIANEYFRHGYLVSLGDVLKKQQAALQEELKILNVRYKAGLDNASNVYAYESKLSELNNAIAANEIDTITSNKILANLVGVRSDEIETLLPTNLEPSLFFDKKLQIMLDNLAAKPEIQAKKSLVYAADANLDVAKAGFYPNISLNGMIGMASLGFNNLLLSGSKTSSYGASIYLPIFDRAALSDNYQAKNDEKSIAIYEYNNEVLKSINEVISSLSIFEKASSQFEYAKDNYGAQAKNLYLAQKNYDAGIIDKSKVLSQDIVRLDSIKNTLTTRLVKTSSFINIIRANGGIPYGE